MTVKELIEELQKLRQDATIYMHVVDENEARGTYADGFKWSTIHEEEDPGDDDVWYCVLAAPQL